MNPLNTRSVVDQRARVLADYRTTSARRRAAYVALARVVLANDQPERVTSATFERKPAVVA
jgi:hypothetical protein